MEFIRRVDIALLVTQMENRGCDRVYIEMDASLSFPLSVLISATPTISMLSGN